LCPYKSISRHARVISARFSYTPSSSTLFALSPLLQYTIPENLGLFVASLNDSQLRNDPRLAGFNPQLARLQTAIGNMLHLIESDPKWFEKVISVPRPVDTDVVKELSALEPTVRPLPLMGLVEEQPVQDDSSADSAFHSATAVEEIPPVREVLDKPRLSDRTRSDSIHLHGEMVAVIEPLGEKHQQANSDDSGMVSDLTSGQLST
ncbi:hypothetical protein COOONC_07927, partial [Cooperia oncophora]